MSEDVMCFLVELFLESASESFVGRDLVTIDGPGQMAGKTGDPGYTTNYDIIVVLWWREE